MFLSLWSCASKSAIIWPRGKKSDKTAYLIPLDEQLEKTHILCQFGNFFFCKSKTSELKFNTNAVIVIRPIMLLLRQVLPQWLPISETEMTLLIREGLSLNPVTLVTVMPRLGVLESIWESVGVEELAIACNGSSVLHVLGVKWKEEEPLPWASVQGIICLLHWRGLNVSP